MCAAILLAGWPQRAAPSPTEMHCISQVLLGANEEHFFYLSIELHAPPSYYESKELVTLCKKRIVDFELVERHEVAIRWHDREPNTLENTTTPGEVPPFDIQKYLVQERVNFARPSARGLSVTIEDSALVMTRDGRQAVLISAEQLRQQVPDLGPDPFVVNAYNHYAPRDWPEPYQYFLVESRDSNSECGSHQHIVGVSRRQFEEAWRQLGRTRR